MSTDYVPLGVRLGKLGIRLSQKYNKPLHTMKVFDAYGGYLAILDQHISEAITLVRGSAIYAQQSGDLVFSSYVKVVCFVLFF